ncbi:MAG: DUF547 domain-containing protein [Acidobacteria bacterium]|nr:DUF547 domain-containing protein [Acidobacteriota bacterium]MBI3262717.1 DUF547 domain-containing protein [Acidobacteriota bacterium]
MTRSVLAVCVGLAIVSAASGVSSPQPAAPRGIHDSFDEILDLYVRDGLVYYAALRKERGKLDRYVANLGQAAGLEAGRGSKAHELAFWINAYNAFVLQTVIDHYPIRGKFDQYPPDSLRQVPGAFERLAHKAGGRTVTLDAIEKTILPAYQDPRVYLALGRGAVGSGRLLSEAYRGERLEDQLQLVRGEMVQRREVFRIDTLTREIAVTPIVGWHEAEFVSAYGSNEARLESRSPIERAILAFVGPHLMPNERDFIAENQFSVKYLDLDWHLNDLTGR